MGADEALARGLVNRVVPAGTAYAAALALAQDLAALPQTCLRRDRLSVREQHGLPEQEALANEWEHGRVSLTEAFSGAQRFARGAGRHGT